MKKKLLIIVFALGLFALAGCGQKFVESGDTESKYAYGWTLNEDDTITVRIKDEWEEGCVWKAEYNEEVLHCEPGEKEGSFVVGSRNAGTGDLFLHLYRQEQEDWEYSLRISLQGNGSGGVFVLSSTHEEPLREGSYVYSGPGEWAVLEINTSHLWLWRDMGADIRVDKTGNREGIERFELSANTVSVQDAMVEIYDTQAPLLLTVYADIDQNGLVNITRVEESSNTEYGERNVNAFWKQLGFTAPLSDAVEIRSADMMQDDMNEIYAAGELRVAIEGQEYELYLSLLPRIAELSVPVGRLDPMTGEWIAVNITQKIIGLETVQIYQQESNITAIWKQFGCYYVLENSSSDVASMESAVAALMGVSANG